MKLITEEQIEIIDNILFHLDIVTEDKFESQIYKARNILSSLDTYEYSGERKQDFHVKDKEQCINYDTLEDK